jgi:VanZ family protein
LWSPGENCPRIRRRCLAPWAWDKFDHFTAYFGLALLATLGWGLRRSLVAVFLGILVIGASLEGIQAQLGRDPEWGDMLANTIGAVVGLIVGATYLAVPRRPVEKRTRILLEVPERMPRR